MHFPACSLSSHVRMCACLRLRAYWSAGLRPVCVRVSVVCVWCVRVCVPGEPVVGQRISPNQGYFRGGDADDRQPVRFCFPPLLLSSTCLQRLQGPPTRGTTLKRTNSLKMCLQLKYTHRKCVDVKTRILVKGKPGNPFP